MRALSQMTTLVSEWTLVHPASSAASHLRSAQEGGHGHHSSRVAVQIGIIFGQFFLIFLVRNLIWPIFTLYQLQRCFLWFFLVAHDEWLWISGVEGLWALIMEEIYGSIRQQGVCGHRRLTAAYFWQLCSLCATVCPSCRYISHSFIIKYWYWVCDGQVLVGHQAAIFFMFTARKLFRLLKFGQFIFGHVVTWWVCLGML